MVERGLVHQECREETGAKRELQRGGVLYAPTGSEDMDSNNLSLALISMFSNGEA